MGVFENSILVDKKVSVLNLLLRVLCGVGCVGSVLLSLTPATMGSLFGVAILFGVAFYFLQVGSKIEYEYTYIEGELSFARIKDKRKRKELLSVDMDTMILVAPENAGELRGYHNGTNNVVVKDFTSGYPEREIFELVYKAGEKTMIIRFEPDKNMLQLVRNKYPRNVLM